MSSGHIEFPQHNDPFAGGIVDPNATLVDLNAKHWDPNATLVGHWDPNATLVSSPLAETITLPQNLTEPAIPPSPFRPPKEEQLERGSDKTAHLGKAVINEQGGITYTSRKKGTVYTATKEEFEAAISKPLDQRETGAMGSYVTLEVKDAAGKTKEIGLKITHQNVNDNPLIEEQAGVKAVNPNSSKKGVPKFMYLLSKNIAVVKHYNLGDLKNLSKGPPLKKSSYWSITSGIMQGLRELKGSTMLDNKPANIVVREKKDKETGEVKTEAIINDLDKVKMLPSKEAILKNPDLINQCVNLATTPATISHQELMNILSLANQLSTAVQEKRDITQEYEAFAKAFERNQIRQVGMCLAEMMLPRLGIDPSAYCDKPPFKDSPPFLNPSKFLSMCENIGLQKACEDKYDVQGEEMARLIRSMIQTPEFYTIEDIVSKFEAHHNVFLEENKPISKASPPTLSEVGNEHFEQQSGKAAHLGKAIINGKGGITYTSRKGKVYTASKDAYNKALSKAADSTAKGAFGTYVTIKVKTKWGKEKVIGLKISHEEVQDLDPLTKESEAVKAINPDASKIGVPKFMYLIEKNIAVIKHYNMGSVESLLEDKTPLDQSSYWSITSGIMDGLQELKGSTMIDIRNANILVRKKEIKIKNFFERLIKPKKVKTEAIINDLDKVKRLPSQEEIKKNPDLLNDILEFTTTPAIISREDYQQFYDLGDKLFDAASSGKGCTQEYAAFEKAFEKNQIRQVGMSLAEMMLPELATNWRGYCESGEPPYLIPSKFLDSCSGLEKACIEKYGEQSGKAMAALIKQMIENPESKTIEEINADFKKLQPDTTKKGLSPVKNFYAKNTAVAA